jgi:hypothetical protein
MSLVWPHPKGLFSVNRIYSRTRAWPACVAPAKNIYIFIVKREKRMRDAGRCAVYPAAEHPHS